VVVTLAGTGFAADYTAQCYGLIPHKNRVSIDLAGVTSGQEENARAFAEEYHVAAAFGSHAEMLAACRPDIDNIACANAFHGMYTKEAAECGVPVIVLEKPPVVWPGYREGRRADARVRKHETLVALADTLDTVRAGGSRLLYAEDFCYLDGVKGMVELLREAIPKGKGRILMQRGTCGHQGSHAPAYDTPALSGGGSLLNKACHPLGPCLYLKQIEGILRGGKPIRPARVSATALQVMKHQPESAGEHFRVMQ
jgi:predicted dehydrogenase